MLRHQPLANSKPQPWRLTRRAEPGIKDVPDRVFRNAAPTVRDFNHGVRMLLAFYCLRRNVNPSARRRMPNRIAADVQNDLPKRIFVAQNR